MYYAFVKSYYFKLRVNYSTHKNIQNIINGNIFFLNQKPKKKEIYANDQILELPKNVAPQKHKRQTSRRRRISLRFAQSPNPTIGI